VNFVYWTQEAADRVKCLISIHVTVSIEVTSMTEISFLAYSKCTNSLKIETLSLSNNYLKNEYLINHRVNEEY
jgi:hypothetical protein